MIVFTPNTVIKSADVNLNFADANAQYTTVFNEKVASSWSNSTTTFTDVTGWTGGGLNLSGNNVLLFVEFTYYRLTSGNTSDFRVVVGTTSYPSSTGWRQYTNELSSHKMNSRTLLLTGLKPGGYTVKVQGANVSGGSVNVDSADWLRITAMELGG